MTKQIAIFFVAALSIFAVGFAVFEYLMDDAPSPEEGSLAQSKKTAEKDKVVPETPGPQNLVVQSVTGSAERTAGQNQKWVPVEAGNKLLAHERIRTEVNASVKLAVDDHSKIELAGRSELSVRDITDTVHQIHLALGQVSVDYGKEKDRVLKITSDKNKAVAETREGKFVIQNADGHVSVATTNGEVALSAEDKTVVVGANSVSDVAPGEAPAAPTPIPLKVMLRVANPQKLMEQERVTTIAGKTNVGARVHVNNRPAPVDNSGRFRVAVPLHAGRNNLEVTSTTAWGSAEKQLDPIVVAKAEEEGAAPIDSAKVLWGKSGLKKKGKGSGRKTK